MKDNDHRILSIGITHHLYRRLTKAGISRNGKCINPDERDISHCSSVTLKRGNLATWKAIYGVATEVISPYVREGHIRTSFVPSLGLES